MRIPGSNIDLSACLQCHIRLLMPLETNSWLRMLYLRFHSLSALITYKCIGSLSSMRIGAIETSSSGTGIVAISLWGGKTRSGEWGSTTTDIIYAPTVTVTIAFSPKNATLCATIAIAFISRKISRRMAFSSTPFSVHPYMPRPSWNRRKRPMNVIYAVATGSSKRLSSRLTVSLRKVSKKENLSSQKSRRNLEPRELRAQRGERTKQSKRC